MATEASHDKCENLKIPPKGNISGISIYFDTGALDEHGATRCEPVTCVTGTDGEVTLVFQPKNEQPPYGVGPEHTASGDVTISPNTQGDLGNLLGQVVDLAVKYTEPWTVEWHDATPKRIHWTFSQTGSFPASGPGPCGVQPDCTTSSLATKWNTTVTGDGALTVGYHSGPAVDDYAGKATVSEKGSYDPRTVMNDSGCIYRSDSDTTGFKPGTANVQLSCDSDSDVLSNLTATQVGAIAENFVVTTTADASNKPTCSGPPPPYHGTFYVGDELRSPPFPQADIAWVMSGWQTSSRYPDALGVETGTYSDPYEKYTVTIVVYAT